MTNPPSDYHQGTADYDEPLGFEAYMCCGCDGFFKGEEALWAECCDLAFCKVCWKGHRCDVLTDSHGRIVNVGDHMRHVDDWRIYQVVDIIPTFTVGQTCVGERVLKTKLDGKRHTLRTRLMEVIGWEPGELTTLISKKE